MKNLLFIFSFFSTFTTSIFADTPAAASDKPQRPIVIIKADDFRGITQPWENYIEVSRRLGIKFTIGIICESVIGKDDVSAWLKTQLSKGDVEFWNHGWDHKKWTVANAPVNEFFHSGLEHQREHLNKSQEALLNLLSVPCVSLGTPYNGRDQDTLKVLSEHPEIKIFFLHFKKGDIEPDPNIQYLDIISESDGTGKPNATKFKATWEKLVDKSEPISLQFHANQFGPEQLAEYEAIVKYLQTLDCLFILPKELLK